MWAITLIPSIVTLVVCVKELNRMVDIKIKFKEEE